MLRNYRPAIRALIAASRVITGVVYPLLVTGIAQLLFPRAGERQPDRARRQSRRLGLIGQPFSDPKYFWGRPSATAPHPYNAGASSGSNQGPTQPGAARGGEGAHQGAARGGPGQPAPVPVDLVTASGSGLDPHISPAAAEYQVARVAKVRSLPEPDVRELVARAHRRPAARLARRAARQRAELNLALERPLSELLQRANCYTYRVGCRGNRGPLACA